MAINVYICVHRTLKMEDYGNHQRISSPGDGTEKKFRSRLAEAADVARLNQFKRLRERRIARESKSMPSGDMQ